MEFITKQQSYFITAEEEAILLEEDDNSFLHYEYEPYIPSNHKKEDKEAPQKISLHNFKNTMYTGNIGVGDPDNLFEVIFDTGSANIWINSARCTDPGCVKHK